MADQDSTTTVPVINDVIDIRIRCDGAGNLTWLSGIVDPPVSDPNASYDKNVECDIPNLPVAATDAIDTVIAQVLTEYKAAKGF